MNKYGNLKKGAVQKRLVANHDDYARAIIAEGQHARTSGNSYLQHPVITPRGIQIALATVYVESGFVMYANQADPPSLNYAHEAVGSDHDSDGLFQQRAEWWGTAAERMDPALSAAMFYQHLARLNYNDPNTSPGAFAQRVQQSAFPGRYDQRFTDAVALYNRLIGAPLPAPAPTPTPTPSNAPAYQETNQIGECQNYEPRGGTPVDLFIIHTEEGGSNDAFALANFLDSTAGGPNPVSYHYTVDNSVNVVDVVDTDYASWSVLSANDRSINLCFAGSTVNWSRDEWLSNMGNGIQVAAWLAVQDCGKYGIPTVVDAPPYQLESGITDHKYVTQMLGDGNHTDVGPNFPWDVFARYVKEFATGISDEGWSDMAFTPQDLANILNGTNTDGSPLLGPDGADYRKVDLLSPDTESISEGPNTTRSIFDEVTTMAKIVTQTHNGKTLFQMVAALYDDKFPAQALTPADPIKAPSRKPRQRTCGGRGEPAASIRKSRQPVS